MGYTTIVGKEAHSFTANPGFVNAPEKPVGLHTEFDFHLRTDSPARDAGGPLTTTVGSGSGKQIQVKDAGYFYDGYGVTDGDLIRIGQNSPVRITLVNYGTNTITVDRSVSWQSGDWVTLPYNGAAPDLGAHESP
jgi:hypothetical protein